MSLITSINLFLFVSLASLVGSLNGLGVSLLLSLVLLFFGLTNDPSVQWTLYIASLLVTGIFIFTRPRTFFDNFYPLVVISCSTGIGLVVGNIINTFHSNTIIKIAFGLTLIFTAYALMKFKIVKHIGSEIVESNIEFDFLDFMFFVGIGLLAGYLQFGTAAFIYLYIFIKKDFFDIERIDIWIYSTLFITSLINLFFTLVKNEQSIPEFFGLGFVLCVLLGATIARFLYRYLSPILKGKIIITAMFFIGLKIFITNLTLEFIR